MVGKRQPEVMSHPEHGRIPAVKVLECVFALSPDGPILHHHLEEMDVSEVSGVIVYTINGRQSDPERSRCQIIPPLVPAFPVLD